MRKWFAKWLSKPLDPIGFDGLKVDMHSHFIPGIDDGAASMEDAVQLIRSMQELGYQKVITTPHIMSDFYRNTPEIILEGLAALKEELKKQSIEIEVEAAAEYYLDFDFEEKIKEDNLLTFGDNYILVETSFVEAPPHLNDLIFKLQVAGYKVVLAHPERYPFMDMKTYRELKERNVYLQLNLLSLIGHYGEEVKQKSAQLVEAGMISFVGSDCHHMGHIELYKKCQTEKAWHQLMESGTLLNHTL
jgi:protein-tyrosine phosphatase